jgi:hypothetical protein
VSSRVHSGVQPVERLIPVERIRKLLLQPDGVTMTALVQGLGERRDIISNDLETMRDCLGLAIHWHPGTGTYRLGETPDAGQPRPEGCDLALLYRAIALEEYLYVTLTTMSGVPQRVHALPGKARKVAGRRQVKLRERNGASRVVDLEAIIEVTEAFGINK